MMRVLQYQGIPVWRNLVVIQWTTQIVSAILVLTLVGLLFVNISNEISERQIPIGWSFLDREAQIPIGETVVEYEPSDTYLYAFWVAVLNTIKASVLGVIFATVLGVGIGIARLSTNWLVSKLAMTYMEVFRNIPLLLQLLFWFLIVLGLPPVREGYELFGAIYLNNGGFHLPWASPVTGFWPWFGVTALGIVLAVFVSNWLRRREAETGSPSYPVIAAIVVAIAITVVAFLVFTPLVFESPEPQGRFGRIQGGAKITASFAALLLGLVVFTSAYIAETVRAGIQSVSVGQKDAAKSLGLSPLQSMRAVVFPQALRVIIPPMISQYLNLTKNSSLAAAIGYPDIVSVATTLTQTAPAVSLIAMVMAAYLVMSLFYSAIGNIYNRYTRIKGQGD